MISDFERGQLLLGRYAMKGRLDAGGMGEIYIARDEKLGRDVAIKRVRIDDAAITAAELPLFIERFQQEAQAIAKLRHPNIVTVHDVQQVNDSPFIVMEYFKDGMPLLKWGAQARPSLEQWLSIAKRLFSALHHAHSRGLLHRDIKSENVLARGSADVEDVEVLLIDWGIALDEAAPRLTQNNAVIGTQGSIDPAVAKGLATWSHQSDFYALGVLLYQCLCHAKPHSIPPNTPQMNLAMAYADNVIIPPYRANPEIDGDLNAFLLCLLATEPRKRPPSAKAAIAMIEAIERDERVDFGGLSEKYPTTPLVLDDSDVQLAEAGNDAGAARKQRGTVRLPGSQREDSVAAAIVAEFGDAQQERGAGSEKRAAEQPKEQSKLSGLQALEPEVIAESPSPSKPTKNVRLGERLSEFRNDEEEQIRPRKAKWPQWAVGVLLLALVVLTLWARRVPAPQQVALAQEQPTLEAVKASDLQPREQPQSALDKLSAEAKPVAGASLNNIDPSTRAQYAASNDAIGGTIPPTPAALRGGTRHSQPNDLHSGEKPSSKIDLSAGGLVTQNPSDKRAGLPISHGTIVEARLVERLDTSSGLPVQAKLTQSLQIDATQAIPAGSIFYGRAFLQKSSDILRSGARFDKVVYPDGTQHRVSAVSVTHDGREGFIDPEYTPGVGDTGSDDTAGRAGNVAKNAIADGLSSLPGANTMSGTIHSAMGETSDAVGKPDQKVRQPSRMVVQKNKVLRLLFRDATLNN